VQGCAEELDELLERSERAFGCSFELWVVGDVVNRGPGNLHALKRVREHVESGRGRYVLGNHELNLLRISAGQRSLAPLDTTGDVLGAADAEEWIEWIRRRPLVETGRLGRQDFAMVHAAVAPDWSLDELVRRARQAERRLSARKAKDWQSFLAGDPASDADLDTLLRLTGCRSVDAEGRWSAQLPELADAGFVAWHEAWRARTHDYGVVYGHWALQGLHVEDGLRGLDTGCVHHGRGRDGYLTAWLPAPDDDTPFHVPDDRFWQIPARRAYYAHKDLPGNEKSD